jgi:hypothetical protein
MPRRSRKARTVTNRPAPAPIPLPPEYAFLAPGVKCRAARELRSLSQRWLTLAARWPIGGQVKLLSGTDFQLWQDLERDLRAWGLRHGRIAPGPEGSDDPLIREAVECWRAERAPTPSGSMGLPRLDPTATAALAVIRAQKGQGLSGKEIVKELARKGLHIQESTLRRHVLPKLAAHGIRNERARGGYYDAHSCP